MGNLDKMIAEELGPLTFGELLREGWQWLMILQNDPPRGWNSVISDIESSLREIQLIYGDVQLDLEKHDAARERLIGFCHRMRRRHGGASVYDVLAASAR